MSRRFHTLSDWLQWLETLHPVEIDLGLERIKQVADKLQLYQFDKKPAIISVAGTNGKGSFVATLKALLLANKENVGAYTSPHILRYNERIALNHTFAQDEEICAAFEKIDKARGDISLSYFEFGTLAAFLLFKEKQLNYWLCEIGLGGRLDAVNILDPDIAVITSIDLDHQQWLGDSRELIAIEKAGILRKNGTLVLSETDEPATLTDCIGANKAQCYRLGLDYRLEQKTGQYQYQSEQANFHWQSATPLQLPLPSVAAALKTAELLKQLPDESTLAAIMNGLQLPGRMQKATYGKTNIILDVAHNPAACAHLAKQLEGGDKHNALIAMMKDKDLSENLKPLIPYIETWHCCDLKNTPRAASARQLADTLKALGVKPEQIHCHESPADALPTCTAYNSGTLLVFGSFFTVEAVLRKISH